MVTLNLPFLGALMELKVNYKHFDWLMRKKMPHLVKRWAPSVDPGSGSGCCHSSYWMDAKGWYGTLLSLTQVCLTHPCNSMVAGGLNCPWSNWNILKEKKNGKGGACVVASCCTAYILDMLQSCPAVHFDWFCKGANVTQWLLPPQNTFHCNDHVPASKHSRKATLTIIVAKIISKKTSTLEAAITHNLFTEFTVFQLQNLPLIASLYMFGIVFWVHLLKIPDKEASGTLKTAASAAAFNSNCFGSHTIMHAHASHPYLPFWWGVEVEKSPSHGNKAGRQTSPTAPSTCLSCSVYDKCKLWNFTVRTN